MDRPTINYYVDDYGTLHIYKGNYKLAEISDCAEKSDLEIYYLVDEILAECEVE